MTEATTGSGQALLVPDSDGDDDDEADADDDDADDDDDDDDDAVPRLRGALAGEYW